MRILQETSANDMLHQQRPSCISHGVCTNVGRHQSLSKVNRPCSICYGVYTSSKRHQPTAGSISPGLLASTVACMHLVGEVGQCNAASTKACTRHAWRLNINCATFEFDNFWQHQLRPVCFDQANGRQHQPRTSRITHSMCTSARQHQR